MKTPQNSKEICNLLRREFGVTELVELGKGGEGVAYHSGDKVFKCLLDPERWRDTKVHALLRELPKRMRGFHTLPEVLEVRECGDLMVIVSRFEPFERMASPMLPEEMLAFLKECQEAGLAHNNIKPDNFVRVAGGIRLVDLGSDLREIRPDRFHDMAARCFLTLRYPQRADLEEIMRDCLRQKDHPALTGFAEFMQGMDSDTSLASLNEMIVATCRKLKPASLLDYGAGKGRIAEELARAGIAVTAFDPGWETGLVKRPSEVTTVDRAGLDQILKQGRCFNTVLCSRVLCEIKDDESLSKVLEELRQLVSDNGHLVLTFCNPFFTDVRITPSEVRQRTSPCDQAAVQLEKIIIESGGRRCCRILDWPVLKRMLRRAGFQLVSWQEPRSADLDRCTYAAEYVVGTFAATPKPAPVSLMIRACAMDHECIGDFVTHMVNQMETPQAFAERYVVVDMRPDHFVRQHSQADPTKLREALDALVRANVIDRYLYAPSDSTSVRACYELWHGQASAAKITSTHSEKGAPNFSTLWGVDQAMHELVMAVDGDLLISRRDPSEPWLENILKVFDEDEKTAFLSPSICRPKEEPPFRVYEDGLPSRVCSRASLWHLGRLRTHLPLPIGTTAKGEPELSWYRRFDLEIKNDRFRSYRMRSHGFGFIHVPNTWKAGPQNLLRVLDRVESGWIPEDQYGQVDLVEFAHWLPQPGRKERFVFLMTGRNVPCGQIRSCVESVLSQDRDDYGMVIIDDASENGAGDYLHLWLGAHPKVMLVRNRRRLGSLQNHVQTIRDLCHGQNLVIVTLDLDDRLVHSGVLSRLSREYDSGADLTVGSMFRTDKPAKYQPNFAAPRSWNNNMWQHLRSFQKRLFDVLPEDCFLLNGKWIEEGSDWAYMLPLAELAQSPRYIADVLYFYRPHPNTVEFREKRHAVQAEILAKPSLAEKRRGTRRPTVAVIGDAGKSADEAKLKIAEEMGRLIIDAGWRLVTGGLGGVMEAASKGARSAMTYREGLIVAILPTLDPRDANPYADIVIPTGLGDYRNGIVANSDAVVIIGGGAGTLSEIAFAWMRRRLIVSLPGEGWSTQLANQRLDTRDRKVGEDDCIFAAQDPSEAARMIAEKMPAYQNRTPPRALVS